MDLFLVFILPVLCANLIHHFLVIKNNLFPVLAYPVDLNISIGGKRIFGRSKTFRGFVVIIILCALFTQLTFTFYTPQVIFIFPAWLSGVLIGFMYCLGELPTSFLKRRADIPPSVQANGKKGVLFYVLEQTDSVVFSASAAHIIGGLSIIDTLWIILIGTGLHVSIDWLLYSFGYKNGLNPPHIFKKLLNLK